MPEFLQFAFSGLTVGAVYALVALGFTLIYNASDVINFAQGEFVMLGGMTTVFLGVGGATILPQSLVVLGGVVVIVVLLWAFIERTLIGKAMVATAANELAARLVGIDTRRIVGLSFAISAAIGAVAGILISPITLTSYDVGTLLALKGFAAAMLGGIGSAVGAVVGGLLLGLLEAFAAGYVSSQYKDAVAFLVILIVLLAIPRGLFGRASVERV